MGLIDFIKNVFTSKSNINESYLVKKVSNKEANILLKKTGLQVKGYVHQVDSYGIKHTYKKHGDEKKEASRGQEAITQDDFNAVPQIVDTPTKIQYAGKNKSGRDLIKYEKDKYFYVEEVRERKRVLALQTFYKRKKKPPK